MGHTVKPKINTLEQSNNTCLWGITAFSLTDIQHNTSMEPSNNTCQWGITAFSKLKQQQCNPSVHSKSFRFKQSSSITFSHAIKRYHKQLSGSCITTVNKYAQQSHITIQSSYWNNPQLPGYWNRPQPPASLFLAYASDYPYLNRR